ncbi:MAG TPA: RcnB family protein [Allosphingosinicella sp.]|jgi:Ni/Co efflux regulator RcnB
MRTLALLSLTAAAIAVPTAADAQPRARAGHSWSQPAQRVIVRQAPGAVARHVAGPGMRRDFREFRRFNRGQILPSYWAGPQFQVRQWQVYGFPQPMAGHRWVRYYDDAHLVDGGGRIRDSRYGYDWDRYDHPWNRDEHGIPMYVGDDDWQPGDRDYAWAEEAGERHGGGDWDYSEYGDVEDGRGPRDCGERGGPCGPRPEGPRGHGPAHGGGGYARSSGHSGSSQSGYGYSAGHAGYGASYGYGGGAAYGYGGATMTITETTVETGGSGGSYVVEEVIEEEIVETRARARAVRRAPPRRAAPPPRRPIRGERG